MHRYQLKPLMEAAHALLEAGQLVEAAAAFHQIAEEAPTSEQAPYMLGIAHIRMGKDNEAIIAMKRAIKVMPDFRAAHGVVGVLLLHQGKDELAEGHFNRATKMGYDLDEAHQIVSSNRPANAGSRVAAIA